MFWMFGIASYGTTLLNQVKVLHRPRLLSDNGPSYVSSKLGEWLDDNGIRHIRKIRKNSGLHAPKCISYAIWKTTYLAWNGGRGAIIIRARNGL
jgi:hypothetical protein